MVAYGLVAALYLQENIEELLPGLDDLNFLFILNTKFVGDVFCILPIVSIHLIHTISFFPMAASTDWIASARLLKN
jgi:hypothetical protein